MKEKLKVEKKVRFGNKEKTVSKRIIKVRASSTNLVQDVAVAAAAISNLAFYTESLEDRINVIEEIIELQLIERLGKEGIKVKATKKPRKAK